MELFQTKIAISLDISIEAQKKSVK